jgi:uncharacterized protein (DUF2147 family)
MIGRFFVPNREVRMRWLFAIAALLMAGTAAQAQYTFEYNGKTIRIDPDRGTVSIPGVFDNTRRPSKRSRNDQDKSRKASPEQAKTEPQAPAAAPTPGPAPSPVPSPAPSPVTAEPAPAPTQAPVTTSPEPPPVTAKSTPAETSMPAQSTGAAPTAPPVKKDDAPVSAPPVAAPAPLAAPVSPPVVAAAPSSVPEPKPAAPAAQPANSPLGLWLTEEKEGKVRIEQCGANLCGYSVDPKSNQNREQVLINMKPGKDSRWSGRIFDPNTGSTYDSTIALKGPDTLRVQGCAFGGMFCGGQTWSRLN